MRSFVTFSQVVILGVAAMAAGAQQTAGQESARGCGNAVTRWNAVASEIFPVEPGPIIDGRAYAILHAAVHDAVNGVERRYQPYTADLSSPDASIEAAVAAAARDVMVALAPTYTRRIEEEYAAALAEVPDGKGKRVGVALGQQCAQANLERRAADGVPPGPWPPQEGPITEPVYVPTGEPGDYDFTPPFDRPPLGPIALFPGWGHLKPFVADLEKYGAPGPDPLRSRAYAKDLEFLKRIGRKESRIRTKDQTEMAFFWFESLGTWQRIVNGVLQRTDADPWQAARILALMNFAVADAEIKVFEEKYQFRFWRPITAIRRADEDGNPLTTPEQGWLPLLSSPPEMIPPPFTTPPIPEYPSAAAIGSAAAAEVLIRTLGDRHHFEATSDTLPGVTRRFTRFSQAAEEVRLSRVYGGIHFVRAIEDGADLGRAIGREVSRALPPVDGNLGGRERQR